MFKLYVSDVVGIQTNCRYPNEHNIIDEESFRNAVTHDFVCSKYKNNYRVNDNFIESECLGLDLDNEHSDNLNN